MIIGIGMDIIEIRRIETALRRRSFCQRVFTPGEQQYCDSRGTQRPASYAARFAGKEAVLKALGVGLSGGTWQDIEILPDGKGQPCLQLSGYFAVLAQRLGVGSIYISLTHAREYAGAQVILEGKS